MIRQVTLADRLLFATLCSWGKFPATHCGAGGSPFLLIYVPSGVKGDRKLPYLYKRLKTENATRISIIFLQTAP